LISLQASLLSQRSMKTLSTVDSSPLTKMMDFLESIWSAFKFSYFLYFNNEMLGFSDRNLSTITLSHILVLPWPVYIEFLSPYSLS